MMRCIGAERVTAIKSCDVRYTSFENTNKKDLTSKIWE